MAKSFFMLSKKITILERYVGTAIFLQFNGSINFPKFQHSSLTHIFSKKVVFTIGKEIITEIKKACRTVNHLSTHPCTVYPLQLKHAQSWTIFYLNLISLQKNIDGIVEAFNLLTLDANDIGGLEKMKGSTLICVEKKTDTPNFCCQVKKKILIFNLNAISNTLELTKVIRSSQTF